MFQLPSALPTIPIHYKGYSYIIDRATAYRGKKWRYLARLTCPNGETYAICDGHISVVKCNQAVRQTIEALTAGKQP